MALQVPGGFPGFQLRSHIGGAPGQSWLATAGWRFQSRPLAVAEQSPCREGARDRVRHAKQGPGPGVMSVASVQAGEVVRVIGKNSSASSPRQERRRQRW